MKVKAMNGSKDNLKGILTSSSLENIKYKNLRIEITDTSISFYACKDMTIFYTFTYYRYYKDRELDLYKALLDFDEKIISDIVDPIFVSKTKEFNLIILSNQVNDIIEYMTR